MNAHHKRLLHQTRWGLSGGPLYDPIKPVDLCLLDRYLTRELMIPLAYCLVGFLTVCPLIGWPWLRTSGMPA